MASASKLNRQVSDLEGRRDDLTRRVEELEATLAQERAAHAKLKTTHPRRRRVAPADRVEPARGAEHHGFAFESSREASEARGSLREREAEIRDFEQRAVESALAARSKDATIADVEKDLAAARASHAEVEAIRATLNQRSPELAKSLEAKGAALQRAEQKIVAVEGRIADETKTMEAERDEFQARLAKLKEQLEAEQAARAFAEGALQAARQDRGSRRHDAEGAAPVVPKELSAPAPEGFRDKIARLRG